MKIRPHSPADIWGEGRARLAEDSPDASPMWQTPHCAMGIGGSVEEPRGREEGAFSGKRTDWHL